VIEAEKTFIIARDEMVSLADRYGMIIVARRDAAEANSEGAASSGLLGV
jgi:hypothetical protein